MMTERLKNHEVIGCCGIDCALCPRYHTQGASTCPGCGGPGFKEKHPSCGCLTCCVLKKGYEVCSDCAEYPCQRFESEKAGFDSFVTHQRVFPNLDSIKSNGIGQFIEQQKIRSSILINLLNQYDEGRSKSFFCTACALLPIETLQEIFQHIKELSPKLDLKERNRLSRSLFTTKADSLEIKVTLNKKP